MISEELIIQLVNKKNHKEAFGVAQLILYEDPDNENVVLALKQLTAALRSERNKMVAENFECTRKYQENENLLFLVNDVTAQDMYGRDLQ